MTDVLVVGDANPDLILRGDVVPRFGQAEQIVEAADLVLGGSGAIVAHGLARLGRSVRLCAAVGADPLGDLVARLLHEAGVDTAALVRVAERTTGTTVVLSGPDDRAVLTHLGAIPALSPQQARSALAVAAESGARHLHVASFFLVEGLKDHVPSLLAEARTLGLTTSLDPNYDPAEQWRGVLACLPSLDLLLPNRTEVLALAANLTGVAADGPEAAAEVLAARGPLVVVKDGADGAVAVAAGEASGTTVLREPAVPVTAVDTTGAGDSFDAAYLDAFLRGLGPSECLRRACRAGALSTAAPGGTGAQPTLDQITIPERDTDVLREH